MRKIYDCMRSNVVFGFTLLVTISMVFGTANAAVINVPADYATIQAAVTNAIAGDEIVVASGTYAEGNITINKALTIRGANSGISAVSGTRGAESVLDFSGLVSGFYRFPMAPSLHCHAVLHQSPSTIKTQHRIPC